MSKESSHNQSHCAEDESPKPLLSQAWKSSQKEHVDLQQNQEEGHSLETSPWSARGASCLKSSGLSSLRLLFHGWRSDERENRKMVVKRDRPTALFKCWIHVLPSSGIVALSVLNLKGVYIGAQLHGSTTNFSQSFDILMLQVTAKLLELLVVASLGTIVMDIIRNRVIGIDGIPLGLLASGFKFQNLSYLWSPEFTASFKRKSPQDWRAVLVPCFIAVAGIIAALAGPSSATLMIPRSGSSWPAGGSYFFFPGSNFSLWPLELNSSWSGGSPCLSPDPVNLGVTAEQDSNCLWAGYDLFKSQFESEHVVAPALAGNMSILDNDLSRQIYWVQQLNDEAWESWALASDLAVGSASALFGATWTDSIRKYPHGAGISSASNYRYRAYKGTVATVRSPLAAARTKCALFESSHNQTTFEYPVLPEYALASDLAFVIDDPRARASSSGKIGVQWLPIPIGNTSTSDGGSSNLYPSALVIIHIPKTPGQASEFAVLACSVDARWTLGNNILLSVNREGQIQVPQITNTRQWDQGIPSEERQYWHGENDYGFLPVDDGSWKSVKLGLDWLDALTPAMDGGHDPQWNTLSTIMDSMDLSNRSGYIKDWTQTIGATESVLAVAVTNGMSRVSNTRYQAEKQSWEWLRDDGNAEAEYSWDTLFKDNGYAFGVDSQLASSPENSEGNLTRLHWSVTVAGYCYTVNSPSSALALALLFFYLVVASAHTVYLAWTARIFDAWDSIEELIVLSHKSPRPAPETLTNTSAGILRGATLGVKARVRAASGQHAEPLEEELHLTLGGGTDGSDDHYSTVQENKIYGAALLRRSHALPKAV